MRNWPANQLTRPYPSPLSTVTAMMHSTAPNDELSLDSHVCDQWIALIRSRKVQ